MDRANAKLTVVGTSYNVIIYKDRYGINGALALLAEEVSGEPFATLSVNIVDGALPSEKLPAGHCYLKDWSENEGLFEQLVAQGLVKSKGVRHQSTGAPLVEVLF